jgi:MHS family proline/betaine transporter-like MFS transporter
MFIDTKHKNNLTKKPIQKVLSGYFPQTILIFLLSGSLAVSIYLLIGYFPTFFVSIMKVSLRESMIISFIGLLALSIFVPIFGLLSDIVNKKILHGLGAFGFLTCSYLIFHLAMGKNIFFLMMSEILMALFIAPIAGSLISMLSEMFPTNIRYTGVSIGYNIGMAVFGGVTPLIAMYLTKLFQSSLAPSYYLCFVGAITLLSLLLIKPNHLRHMN